MVVDLIFSRGGDPITVVDMHRASMDFLGSAQYATGAMDNLEQLFCLRKEVNNLQVRSGSDKAPKTPLLFIRFE
jgi:hypothetical protein